MSQEDFARKVAEEIHDGPGSALHLFAKEGTLRADDCIEELNEYMNGQERSGHNVNSEVSDLAAYLNVVWS